MKANGAEIRIDYLLSKTLELWWQAKADFPSFPREISRKERGLNKRKIEDFRQDLAAIIKNQGSNTWRHEIFSIFKTLESSIIGYNQNCIDFFSDRGYPDVTEAFLETARNFDPQIGVYDISQAIRNVWIMNSIQILFGQEAVLSPSVFSYSMLYPYSDNYLDDEAIALPEKLDFNKRFLAWIKGEEATPVNGLEEQIYRLVKHIEGQYARQLYPLVYESLLAIHGAQNKSLQQQRGRGIPFKDNIIGITFEKGGTSVLADGYLVKGNLTEQEAIFIFGYGAFLQMIDDLQDLKADRRQGHMTIFSQLAGKWPLDQLVNKLFWFIEDTLEKINPFISPEAMKLRAVMKESCKLMILEAISHNKRFFTREYLKGLETYSILPLGYWKGVKKRFQKTFTAEELQRIIEALEH